MKLQRITLKNFRCHKDFTLEIGNNTEIIKPGGWGKSTIADAFYWLFTDAPMSGEKSYSPKPKKDGEDIHGVDSSVEVETDDHVLKKIFSEKWEKKRGSNEKIFSGNQTEYYIDRVPYTKSSFMRWIEDNIAGKEELQCMLNPAFFCLEKPFGMGWERRREILFGLLGEIDESELYTGEFESVPEILRGNNTEDALKAIKAQMKKLNEDIKDIPVLIDEIRSEIDDIEVVDTQKIEDKIKQIEKEKQTAHDQIASIMAGDDVSTAAQSALDGAQATLNQLRSLHASGEATRLEAENKALQTKHEKMSGYLQKLHDIQAVKKQHEFELKSTRDDLEIHETGLANAIKMHKETSEIKFVPASLTCPTCEQIMPKHKIESAQAAFNKDKSDKLEEIVKKGKIWRESTLKLKEKITMIEARIIEIVEKESQAEKLYNSAKSEYDNAVSERSLPKSFEDTPEFEKASQAVDSAKAALDSIDVEEKCVPYLNMIEEKTELQKELNEKLFAQTVRKARMDRIDELREQERTDSEKYAQLEKSVYLLERFTIAKMELFNNAADKYFSTLRFRMFRENITNDGIQQCCDILFRTPAGLVPYVSASASEKIRAHIELAEVLQKHWKIKLPMIIDEAESIAHSLRPVTELQVLWLAHEQDAGHGGF